MDIPNSVCWNVTRKCNDNCLFCYRDLETKELNFDDQKKVIDQVAEANIYKLTFAGGEPLLVPKIKELMLYAKRKGLLVSLTTNGILLKSDLLDFCLENLDWLTLSLDGADEEVQSRMTRSEGHVERVLNILKYADLYKYRKCKIKINTVISSLNKEQVNDVADVVLKYHVDRWKIFQFVPLRGMAKKYANYFYISDVQFKKIVERLKQSLKDKETIVTISDRQNIEKAHFVIFPNGDIKISQSLKDQVVGNVLINDLKQVWAYELYQKELHEERTKFLLERN